MPLHEETGLVVSVSEDRALVRVEASSACGSCASTQVCGMTEEGYRVVEVIDPIGVQPAQEVGIEVEGRTLVGAAFTIYGIPLVLLFLGLVGGQSLATRFGLSPDWAGAAGALIAMGGGFYGLYRARTYFSERRTFYPTITRITASAAETAARPGPSTGSFSA